MHDEQDMRRYGGLWRDMRPTAITFLIGSLSLVGVIPFVGFFSKEQILGLAFSKPDDNMVHVLWAVGFATALITGFYTGRMWWLSFWGKPALDRPVAHPHAPRLVMMVPVAILAILSTVGGFIQTRALGFGPALVDNFLAPVVGSVPWEGGAAEIAVTFVTMLLATGLFVWALYSRPWTSYAPWAQRLLERKYYFDEIYDAVFVQPLDWVAGFLQRDVERPVIDAAVVDTGALARWSASELSLTQSGYFRNYVLVFVVGVVSIAAVLLVVRALT
jgi:NADH-quinone oxidoreductase subunit L